MNDETHQQWDELVAAHALHALEPDEELRLLAHVDGCTECRVRLDEFALVAAQLGSLPGDPDDNVQAPEWSAIAARVVGGTAAPTVIPMQRRRSVRLLATAAAVLVIAGGTVAGWQLTRPAPVTTTAAVAACRLQSGCRVVDLHGQHGDKAAVLVEAGRGSLVPVTLATLPANRMYVLWQLPRDGSPIPMQSFRDSTQQTASVPLPTGYADTAAFAVSVEVSGPMPTHPTDVVAVGAAG